MASGWVEAVVAGRSAVELRVGGVDAVDIGRLEERVAGQFRGAERRGGVRGEERIAGAATKDDHPARLDVAAAPCCARKCRRASACDTRSSRARREPWPSSAPSMASAFITVAEHADEIAADPVDALGGSLDPTEEIAAADNDGDLEARAAGIGDIGRRWRPASDHAGRPRPGPCRASPDSFTSTRRKRGFVMAGLYAPDLRTGGKGGEFSRRRRAQ